MGASQGLSLYRLDAIDAPQAFIKLFEGAKVHFI